MRDGLREKLNTEVTRQQFIQYIGITLLMLFGLHNFLSLLGSHKTIGGHTTHFDDADQGFGSRKFGE